MVTAVPAVVYAVNYPIIIQVISEIQEKSCAFVEMVKIGENSLLSLLFYKILFSILINSPIKAPKHKDKTRIKDPVDSIIDLEIFNIPVIAPEIPTN